MLYKLTEWQSTNGRWHCNCIDDLGNNSAYWVLHARVLGLKADEFLKWLFNQDFKPDYFYYNKEKFLCFWSWKNQEQMRKYKNFINRKAREKNFMI